MLEHAGGVFEDGVGDLAAGEHARQFFRAFLLSGQRFDGGNGAVGASGFFHVKMVVGEAGNLRQMGDTQYLPVTSQTL